MEKHRIRAMGQPHMLEDALGRAQLVDAVDEQTVTPVPGDRRRFAVPAHARGAGNTISRLLARRRQPPLPTRGVPGNATFLMLADNMAFHMGDNGLLVARFCWSANYRVIAQSVEAWDGSQNLFITDDSTVAANCDIPETFGMEDGLPVVLRMNTGRPASVVVERIGHDLKHLVPSMSM